MTERIMLDAIVEFVDDLRSEELPDSVRRHLARSFVDSIGCVVGGSANPAVSRATKVLEICFGPDQASLVGQGRRADILHAALINGLAGAAFSFFDSYSAAHLHAGVTHTTALLSLAEHHHRSGTDFLSAYGAGMEVACRLTKAIALSPAEADIGWSIGGIICGVSSAVAAGKLLGLDKAQLACALGIAASEAAGSRSEHGTMTAGLIFGHAAQVGVRSAMLAAGGFTSSTKSLDGAHGHAKMFSKGPNPHAVLDGLGERYELMLTTFKPYPTDIAIHAGIDAVLRLKRECGFDHRAVQKVTVQASSLAVNFCDRPDPRDELEAKFSLQHWLAVAAIYGRAGLVEGSRDVVTDPVVEAVRAITEVLEVPSLAWDAARVQVVLNDGHTLETEVEHCLGSPNVPMRDRDITSKFLAQAAKVISPPRASDLVAQCWDVANVADMAALARNAC